MLRKKLDKARAEELSQQAAFLVNVAAEAQGLVSLPAVVLETELLQRWVKGEPQVCQEVVQCLQERSERFTPRDLPCLAGLLDGFQASGQADSLGGAALALESSSLETSQWLLLMQQVQFDCRCFAVFRGKLRDHATRMQAVRLQWRARALSANRTAVHSWLSAHTLVVNWEKAAGGEALREQLRWKSQLEKTQQLAAGSLARSLLNLCVSPLLCESRFAEGVQVTCAEGISAWALRQSAWQTHAEVGRKIGSARMSPDASLGALGRLDSVRS
jgi:hypothetical protein